jgi:hypothetical protein
VTTVICGYCGKRYRYQHRCKQGGGVQKARHDDFQTTVTMIGVAVGRMPVVTFEDP